MNVEAYEAGVKFVSDLFLNNRIIGYAELVRKSKNNISYMEFYGIYESITTEWRRIIRNDEPDGLGIPNVVMAVCYAYGTVSRNTSHCNFQILTQIYGCRCKKVEPNIYTFKEILLAYRNYEKYFATINGNLDKQMLKWHNVKLYTSDGVTKDTVVSEYIDNMII